MARVADKTLSRRIAKVVFEIMFETGGEADAIIDERSLQQVSDTGAIEAVVDQIIADNLQPQNPVHTKVLTQAIFGSPQ